MIGVIDMIYADRRDILTLTMRHNGAYIPTDGQTEQTGSENRSVATTRMPESVSGEGGRSALRGIGFLRRPRSGSGEVRDGAAGRNRRSNEKREGGGGRVLAARRLSRAGP